MQRRIQLSGMIVTCPYATKAKLSEYGIGFPLWLLLS